jgi:outer membrane lipoprotein SlyB
MRIAAALAAALLIAGCASAPVQEAPVVVRSRAPVNYETTITNFFDLTIRGAQPNRVLTFGKPEPGGCPLGGHVTSALGWVVPVQDATRTGSLTGQAAGITVKGREYYFWFRQETLYGVTQRMELCP